MKLRERTGRLFPKLQVIRLIESNLHPAIRKAVSSPELAQVVSKLECRPSAVVIPSVFALCRKSFRTQGREVNNEVTVGAIGKSRLAF